MEPEVLVEEHRGRVLVLRLNRPEARNALSFALLDALVSALERAEVDPQVGAVVLTGTGDRSFCAGLDLREFAGGDDMTDPARRPVIDGFQRLMEGEIAVPLVGAANAPLALAATKELVRLAATDGARYRERRDHWRPVVFGSQDAVEGATAYVEKRDPVWQGH